MIHLILCLCINRDMCLVLFFFFFVCDRLALGCHLPHYHQVRSVTIGLVGGSGFVGSRVALRLAESGYHVRIISRHPYRIQRKVRGEDVTIEEGFSGMNSVNAQKGIRSRIRKTLDSVAAPSGLRPDEALKLYMEFFTVSLGGRKEKEQLRSALTGCDGVINFVGLLAEGVSRGSFEKVHHKGAANVAAMAKETNVRRLIHVSAIGANLQSDAAYARTKALGEEAVMREYPTATILRPSLVVGRGDGFFSKLETLRRISPIMPVVCGGKTKFQPVHIDDVSEAMVACLTSGQTQGKIYELGGPNIYTFRELIELFLTFNRRKRLLLPIPPSIAYIQGMILQYLPTKVITTDQVRLLQYDNIVSPSALSFQDLNMHDLLSVTEALEDTFKHRRFA